MTMPVSKKKKKSSSWMEKLDRDEGFPKVVPIGPSMTSQWGEGTMVIPAPREVDAIMKRIPAGKLITINEIRSVLARRHGATMGCPMTTGIFAWIAANAAEEDGGTRKAIGVNALLADPQDGGIPQREVPRRRPGPEGQARGRRPSGRGARQAVRGGGLRERPGRRRGRGLMPAIGGDSPGREGVPGLVLASTSAYRRALIERLGIAFRCRAPHCDEAVIQSRSPGMEPRLLAETLAMAKAASLSGEEPGSAIIGCDQLVSFDGRVFGKPGTVERAVDQLAAMAGRTHELITSLVVVRKDEVSRHTDITWLRMRRSRRSDRALRRGGSSPGLRRQLQAGIARDRPVRPDRERRPFGDHGASLDRAGHDPPRAGLRDPLTRRPGRGFGCADP